jgi:hypothetical protein
VMKKEALIGQGRNANVITAHHAASRFLEEPNVAGPAKKRLPMNSMAHLS